MISISQVTTQYFEYTSCHWCSYTKGILEGLLTVFASPPSAILVVDKDQALQLTCECWMLNVKVLRSMLVHGFQNDMRSIQVCFFNMFEVIELHIKLLNRCHSFRPIG